MYGAILGDMIGAPYEFDRGGKTKDFPLFSDESEFTDDTVMTIAVADALLGTPERAEETVIRENLIDSMHHWGEVYPDAGYGARFAGWLSSDNREPYNSYGNGSAMRVSPCGWVMDCGYFGRTGLAPYIGRGMAELSAAVTHNHPEGIRGALATADAIFFSRFFFGGWACDYEEPVNDDPAECKRRIKEFIEQEHGYDLSRTLDEIRPSYRFNETCQDTVPQAIIAFLESNDFEDAIRNAISLGGDSDTLAAITGSIAEAAYGIPEDIKEQAYSYLDEPLKAVLRRWKKFITQRIHKPI